MKNISKIISLLLALALCISFSPAAFAGGTETENDLDAILDGLLEEYEADANDVYAGYLNLVTGECPSFMPGRDMPSS